MTRQKLVEQIFKKQSYLCVGLDTDINKIPKHLLSGPDPVFSFNKAIIDSTKDLCVSYKINTAFYEALGVKGWEAMEKTVRYIGDSHFKIADAKRGDIGNTSDQYARAFFETLPFDAITVAPYMGEDSVKPFLEYKGKWAIVLGLTSNKGSENFQKVELWENERINSWLNLLPGPVAIKPSELQLYKKVLIEISQWGNPENLMFVIGATQAEEFTNIRKLTPSHFYLVPGVGAQGGSLKDISEKAMIKDCGILVNVSRAIIYASEKENFAEEARAIAQQYQFEMKEYLSNVNINRCGVNEIFNTSRGLTVILDFTKDVIPKTGMVLKNDSGYKWKIIGIALGRPIELTNFTFKPRFNELLHDCILQPLNHTEKLTRHDILEVEN